MNDSTAANLYLFVGLGSSAGIVVDLVFYPSWWVLVPLFVVMVADIIWGIWEAS